MTFEIKRLIPADFELAKELFLLFQIDDEVKNPTSASDKYLKNILSKDDFQVLAAFENEKIIGGLTAYELAKYKSEAVEMFLYELVVKETHRQKGAATELIKFLEKICREKGISEMFLATEMDNEPAKKLYESTGGIFEETAIYIYKFD